MSWSNWSTVEGDGLDNFKEIIYEKKHHQSARRRRGARLAEPAGQDEYPEATTVNEMFRAFYDANHDPP